MNYSFLDNNITYKFDDKSFYSIKSGMIFYSQLSEIDIVTEEIIENKNESKFFGLIKNTINKTLNKHYIQFNYKNIVNEKIITIKISISSKELDKAIELVDYIKKRISYENYKRKEPKNLTVSTFYEKMNIKDYIVLDLETTGLNPEKDKITEYSLLKVKNGKIVDKLCNLVNPETHIPVIVEELTGITNEMVRDKKTLREHIEQILDFIGNDIIIGHNVIFDISFIKTELCNIKEKEDVELKNIEEINYIDTLLLVELLEFPTKNYKLETLKKYLKIEDISHRAENDCLTTQKLYEICNKLIEKNITINDYKEQEIINS